MKRNILSFAMAATFLTPVFGPVSTSAQSKYDEQFVNYPTYNSDDLELSVSENGTFFRLWSPAANGAIVNLYDHGAYGKPFKTLEMTFHPENGTWTTSVPEKLYGKFYTFQIEKDGKWLKETPGVWAKAVGINGNRAAIINFDDTNPEGWADDKGPQVDNFTDVIVYEMHHRDFSMHPSSGISNKGKFLALTEPGTLSPDSLKTGIDHLKELGITHVHILPSYDYNSVDEANPQFNTYNWGYDPLNYNAPEGSYSTNAAEPSVRIKEMKEMIKALHDAGIGVIMDVVYNHTATNDDSNFELTAPGYYHRHWDDGRYSDASGCGNETASERKQMHDYIINSIKYWTKEYHIDGFRFDLMAIHDTETMTDAAKAIKEINPDGFIYGEGWTAGDSPLSLERRALKENVSKMTDIAVFSDDIRDAVKGHYSNAEDRGFATGKPGLEETVKIGIVASTAHPQVDYSKGANSKFAYASSPEMIVNYVSCHDDLSLTDKLRKSMPDATEEERLAAAKLAQTIVFTSQGTPFMFAGEEIFRDKQGVHNSYKSPDSINAIDWNLKKVHADQFHYYKNLISLRKSHPAFRMTTADDIARHLVFDEIDSSKTPNLISYTLKDNANGDEWKDIKVVFNGASTPNTVTIKGKWIIVAHDGKINPDGLGTFKGGKITLAPYSALIMHK
ncbi:MAG: type I pullulanase [Prevotella sp.]|nr:type I pullulanase [Bacteroides sp.]MCM1366459.1 type I pullulanase [Prevotella sp.]MCM1437061.1 type I pullulanase [Prevotella sp.]